MGGGGGGAEKKSVKFAIQKKRIRLRAHEKALHVTIFAKLKFLTQFGRALTAKRPKYKNFTHLHMFLNTDTGTTLSK